MPIIKVRMGSMTGINLTDAYIRDNTVISDTALSNSCCEPIKMCCDNSGDVYILSTYTNSIFKISQSNNGSGLSLLAGAVNVEGFVNSTKKATDARFNMPTGICSDKNGVIYVADAGNYVIRIINDGAVSVYMGKPGVEGADDGDRDHATFGEILDICFDNSGTMFVSELNKDNATSRIRKIYGGRVITWAGAALGDADDVQASPTIPTFVVPFSMCVDKKGDLFVSDFVVGKIKRIVPRGWVYRYSGNGSGSFSFGSKPNWAYTCSYDAPYGICVDSSNNLYVADPGAGFLLRVDETGRPRCIANFNTVSGGIVPLAVTINRSQELYVYCD